MPNIVNQKVFVDGPRRAIVHLYLESDGVSGEMKDQLVINTRTDIVPVGQVTPVTIDQIWWSLSYFDARISIGDVPNAPFWVLPVGGGGHADFRGFGGIKLPQSLDGTGMVLLSTNGFAPKDSWGSIILALKKD